MTRSVVSRFSVSEFNLTFSWERSEKLQSERSDSEVVEPVFYVFDKDSAEYNSRNDIISRCLHSSNNGLVLSKPPLPDSDGPPCDMSFLTKTQDYAYCASELIIVSEARNLELYVNRMYETTVKGSRIRLDSERPEILYQSSLDLSEYSSSGKVAKLKFVSMADKKQLKILTVIFAVSQYSKESSSAREMMLKAMNPSAVDMDQVKSMLTSMALNLPTNAERLMGEIDRQQQIQAAQLQHVLALGSNINQNHIERIRGETMRLGDDLASYESQHTQGSDSDHGSDHRRSPKCMRNGLDDSCHDDIGDRISACEEEQQRSELEALSSMLTSKSMENKLTTDEKVTVNEEAESRVEDDRSQEDTFSDLLSNYLKKLDTTETRNRSQSDCSKAADRWEAYLRSRIRASQKTTNSSGMTGSKGKGKKEQKYQGGNGKRCQECGCSGCVAVYGSLSTSICALEERIMARVDSKLQDMLHHIDNRFDSLQQILLNKRYTNCEQPLSDVEDRPEAEMEEAECIDGVYKSEV